MGALQFGRIIEAVGLDPMTITVELAARAELWLTVPGTYQLNKQADRE